ncbi:riboflavin kinase / FMN adenylyltransferase [Catalinimonas alkaloidigena]|uniref:Riboflavin biosynthesis protein n=1 Tax=Catalinimonas alkaloidigena TaxID=1075417 RepID=A0A1G9AGM9_9BACT|nr:bifunctional riboflavin kinase/FAD synthetase [Catalinimonas alkaloidigena]SDK26512.1 riboflavin kinase / FMN adenylyltransferase [Catalinimonas alkaloidigena]
MKVYHGPEQFQKLSCAVVTSGTFDGVHIGHQKILSRLREIADAEGGETVLITYWPHPRLVLHPEQHDLQLLSTIDEKIRLLEKYGVDHLLIMPFTKEFSQLTSEQFIRRILVDTIGTRKLVIGYDHRFGRNREGSFEHLKEFAPTYGFTVEEIPRQEIDDVGISSTKIRHALQEGNVHIANEFLGEPYTLTGEVVPGDQRGRQIDFPTANLYIPEKYKLIPANGVYAVRVQKWVAEPTPYPWGGMMNIGLRPTVASAASERRIEVHLFDFHEELYGQRLVVGVVDLIRFEQKFESLASLRDQLVKDETAARRLLA